MSSESTVSETTPLSRAEKNISDNTSTVASPYHVNDNNHYRVSNNNNNNNNNIDINTRINNNLEDTNDGNMEATSRTISRICTDIIVLIAAGVPILCFYLWGNSYKRGFFCDDESLKHPFHKSTIPSWLLLVSGIVVPVVIILFTEIFLANKYHSKPSINIKIFGWTVPAWGTESYKRIGVYLFGAATSQLTVDIAKYSIGRLRPHFFSVCQPIMPFNTTCEDKENIGRYIEDFTCSNIHSSAKMLKEMSLSFPSGHSSFSFYAMVFTALYLQSRMTWRGSKLLRPFLQFVLFMFAWFTSLSRISNYKHHWSDVLAGAIIGIGFGIVVAKYTSDLFVKKNDKQSYLPSTQQDLSTVTTHSTTTQISVNGNHT